ncbi:PREDICTED: uncharacterized protein LOC109587297 [Amphimedon queenslandica]|uniref:SH3 domain-containing protein n=1 Tax=Amphimedon queenslandica TaxID=400682 RepID=A0AAN0JQK0_AMPQE|nr:PREDICTED: uncharacterized protein LOC109587297 [Amphimedon queenslandica]|eukprot:XP_019859102.1 PREDICTED: uncharacterized protein LOC109587297 [Amphimedon queenslandica]
MFIEDFDSDLETELSLIKNLQGVMRLIRKKCSLANIVILEAVVEHFEIDDAQKYINDYKREIDESCCNLSVDLCLNQPFDVVRASPPLKCETATYVLGWEATEHKLKDVTDIVSKSSGKFVKLVDIKTSYRIRRGIKMEIDHLQLLLTNKSGLLDQSESLIGIKREIADLQEQISLMSEHILNKREENKKKYRDIMRMNKPTEESFFIARYDYHAIASDEISFSEGEQIRIYEKEGFFYWKGRSLVSGDEGFIPSSCVYSKLESLQLLEFLLSVEEECLAM